MNIPAEPWMAKVKVGDMLRPDPRWNRAERPPNRLPNPCPVLEIDGSARSQSGMTFTVRDCGGTLQTLDAAWFLEPEEKR